MAGYTTGKSMFKDAQEYLDNHATASSRSRSRSERSACAAAAPTGRQRDGAEEILGGVVIGLALALMGPSLVA